VSKLKAIIDSGRKAGIEAYHGSPYDFPAERELQFDDPRDVPIFDQDISIFDGRAYQPIDAPVPEGARVVQEFPLGRFDSSKIGTGEGAQAYGQGSYLAGNEDVARGYRDQLTKPRVQSAQRLLDKSGNDVDLAIENAKKEIDRLKSLDLTPETGSSTRERLISSQEEKIAELTKLKNTGQMSKGSMYKVNIDADPDELIDWDELIDEQPKKVMDKLQSADWWQYAEEGIYDIAGARGENPTGADLVRWLEQDGQDYAAEALEDLGIKGVKYADAFTRHKPKDKRSNNYVIFDPRIIEISKKYGISIPLASAVIAGTVTPEEAQAVGFGSVVKKSLSDKTDEMQQGIGSLPAGDEMVTGGDLQFLMNIRPGSLRAQQDMGAFPMPSLAVVRQDQPFDSFGEITLVGDPASFDPKRLKANVVFNADAYTVRAPRPFRIAQKDAGLQFKNRFEPVAKEFQEGRVSDLTYELGNMELKKRATAQGFADIQRFFESDLIADVVFLREKGITDIPTTEGAGGNIFLERASLQDLIKPYADERRAWGRKELDKLFKEEEFFDASTNRDYYTGKGLKLKPYTAEEVLKFMKKNRGSAQEGGMATPGALRASLTEKLSSLKDIRAQSGKLVGSDEFKNFQNSSYERISDLAESLRPFYKFDSSSFGYSNEVIEMLIESQKRGLDRTLSEFGFEDVPDYALQEIQEVKSYFRNAPTEYFEAKPERLVDIEEFEGAIVPEGTSDDIIQALKDSGIKIETYADDAQRLNARKKFGGTAFSVAGGITLVGLVPPQEAEAGVIKEFAERMMKADQMGLSTDQILYHGSTFDIEKFVPSPNTDNDFGTGTYLTISPSDASRNYAGEGPDLTNRINTLSESIQESLEGDWGFNADFWDKINDPEVFAKIENLVDEFEENRDRGVLEKAANLAAKTILKGQNEGVIYPVFVNNNDFAVIGGKNKTVIDLDREQYYDSAREELDRSNFDSDDDFEDAVFEYAEELENNDYESPVASLADTLRYAGASDEAVAEAIDSVLEGGAIDLTEINDIIRRSSSEDFDTGEMLNNGQIMQNVLTDLGYKGVVDNTTGAKFANMGAGRMHTIVFPGNENLIRSINAKFDPENADSPNILASAPPILAPVAGAAGLGAAAMLSPEQAQAQTLNASGFNLQYPIKPKKQPPGLPSLAGQLGLGAMSEIAGVLSGGTVGLGEYLRGALPFTEPATGESIRDLREGVSDYVGGLYDAGPEAQAVGQEIMQGIGETIAPIAQYAMEGPIMDERGLNMLPLIAQKE
jgi:hypothetical protein